MSIELPAKEFELLKDDDREIHLLDKVVEKIYTYDKVEKMWCFPAGSREDIIFKLTGLDFNNLR